MAVKSQVAVKRPLREKKYKGRKTSYRREAWVQIPALLHIFQGNIIEWFSGLDFKHKFEHAFKPRLIQCPKCLGMGLRELLGKAGKKLRSACRGDTVPWPRFPLRYLSPFLQPPHGTGGADAAPGHSWYWLRQLTGRCVGVPLRNLMCPLHQTWALLSWCVNRDIRFSCPSALFWRNSE